MSRFEHTCNDDVEFWTLISKNLQTNWLLAFSTTTTALAGGEVDLTCQGNVTTADVSNATTAVREALGMMDAEQNHFVLFHRTLDLTPQVSFRLYGTSDFTLVKRWLVNETTNITLTSKKIFVK